MSNRIAALIYFFVARFPRAGRTQVVKFLYLVDLEMRRHLGRPITDLDYIWHDHGPFDFEIYTQLRWLDAGGFIKGVFGRYPNGKEGWQYTATEKDLPLDLSSDETAIATSVAESCKSRTLDGLLKYVYDTKPMRDAQERGAKGERLRMELVNNEAVEMGEDIHRIQKALQQVERGEVRPFEEIAAELGM
jgi:hypothetical protein